MINLDVVKATSRKIMSCKRGQAFAGLVCSLFCLTGKPSCNHAHSPFRCVFKTTSLLGFSYSSANSITDLNNILDELLDAVAASRGEANVRKENREYHLFGHSYGGLLAYNFLASPSLPTTQLGENSDPKPSLQSRCQALLLSNAAVSMKAANDEYDRYYKQNPFKFWNEHACSVGIPPPLQDSMNNAGSVWAGMDVVLNDIALPRPRRGHQQKQQHDRSAVFPQHVLILTGSSDFGLKASTEQAWNDYLFHCDVQGVHFDDCAHYPFYEKPNEFGSAMDKFLDKIEA